MGLAGLGVQFVPIQGTLIALLGSGGSRMATLYKSALSEVCLPQLTPCVTMQDRNLLYSQGRGPRVDLLLTVMQQLWRVPIQPGFPLPALGGTPAHHHYLSADGLPHGDGP